MPLRQLLPAQPPTTTPAGDPGGRFVLSELVVSPPRLGACVLPGLGLKANRPRSLGDHRSLTQHFEKSPQIKQDLPALGRLDEAGRQLGIAFGDHAAGRVDDGPGRIEQRAEPVDGVVRAARVSNCGFQGEEVFHNSGLSFGCRYVFNASFRGLLIR
jgi:hypothetical protein